MLRVLILTIVLGLAAMRAGASEEFEGPLRALAQGELAVFATDPAVLKALRDQNALNGGMSRSEIDALDAQWRAEMTQPSRPLIDRVISHPGSQRLKLLKHRQRGLVTLVFVTDALGLNVVQSDLTQTYWQGEDAVRQGRYGQAPGTVHLGEVVWDEVSQTYQTLVALPIFDPDNGETIGAVTIGIDLSRL